MDRLLILFFARGVNLRERLRTLISGEYPGQAHDAAIWGGEWAQFQAKYVEGDEVWSFSQGDFANFAGRSGYAILRDGHVVAAIETVVN